MDPKSYWRKESDPDPLFQITDPRFRIWIRIRTKMSRIRNTGNHYSSQSSELSDYHVLLSFLLYPLFISILRYQTVFIMFIIIIVVVVIISILLFSIVIIINNNITVIMIIIKGRINYLRWRFWWITNRSYRCKLQILIIITAYFFLHYYQYILFYYFLFYS